MRELAIGLSWCHFWCDHFLGKWLCCTGMYLWDEGM